MVKALQGIHPLFFLVAATVLEVSGDAVVRVAIFNHAGSIRAGLFLVGAGLLFGYGSSSTWPRWSLVKWWDCTSRRCSLFGR